MKHILAPAHRPVLDRFASGNVLLAFDFDGTLAPIVADPEAAVMRARTCSLLATLAVRYPCVVISGRARRDAAQRLEGIALKAIVGNHGGEVLRRSLRTSADVPRWREALGRALGSERGVSIEDKGYSLAVHYRQSREKKRARAAILAACGDLPGARLVGGKSVVNVVPRDAPHKGIALERERDRLRCDSAIYVGDDETDEDVFALPAGDRLLGIRVGRSRASRAEYCIRDQAEIERLLAALLSRRSEVARPRLAVDRRRR